MISILGLLPAALTLQMFKLDLTPPEQLPLGGYTKRGGKVSDPGGEVLYSRVALFSQGKLRVAVVSLEMLTIPESLVREVQTRIPADIKLYMVATHTHCAPDSQILNDRMTMAIPGIGSYREKWLTWYADRVAQSIQGALRRRPEVIQRLQVSEFVPNLNRSRTPYGYPDRRALQVFANGRVLLSVFSAHATVFDDGRNQTSGDWPGELAKETGGLVLPGAIGDVSPIADGKATAQIRIATFVAHFIESSLRSDRQELSLTLSLGTRPIALGSHEIHPEFAKANGVPEVLAKRLIDTFAPRSAEVTTLGLGDLRLIGIPGEPTSYVGRRISKSGSLRVPLSHVNGWIGYIVDPTHYWLGGYEAMLTLYGPMTSERVIDATKPD
ncbi:MAG: hypothetical protein ABL949_08555 [Fimbriimonadaceae bacterium]